MVSMISQSDAVVMCGIACVGSLLVWNKDKWHCVIAKSCVPGANNRATIADESVGSFLVASAFLETFEVVSSFWGQMINSQGNLNIVGNL